MHRLTACIRLQFEEQPYKLVSLVHLGLGQGTGGQRVPGDKDMGRFSFFMNDRNNSRLVRVQLFSDADLLV